MTSRLGKGLSALIGSDILEDVRGNGYLRENNLAQKKELTIPIDKIDRWESQPRKSFNDESLRELSNSIKVNGVILPIIVRYINSMDRYQIIAGERRWRASIMAGLSEIPAIIRDFSDKQTLETALIENIQRQDLTIIEEAEGYKKLIEEFDYTQEQLAERIGKSRTHITNILRLLILPISIIQMINEGKLSMGHARALIGVENNVEIAKEVIEKNLSVRDTEKIIKGIRNKGHENNKIKATTKERGEEVNTDLQSIEESLTISLGIKVNIDHAGNAGKLIIYYNNFEELDHILRKLGGSI